MKHAIILAGGAGTRLWPASTRALPKQFLPLAPGGRTLLELAVARARAACDHVWLVTSAEQRALAAPWVDAARLLIEPVARNTTAAIAFALGQVLQADPTATVVILPADQYIADEAAMRRALDAAFAAATQHEVCTLGIRPDSPHTGFGYLQVMPTADATAWPVTRFIEKPSAAEAATYIAAGYLWNSGMFVARAQTFADLIKRHAPQHAQLITARSADLTAAYAAVPAISIDYAVMEKAHDVVAVPLVAGWSDVGAWDALATLHPADALGNVAVGTGTTTIIDAHRNVIVTQGEVGTHVAVLGVDDLVVVQAGPRLLVTRRGQTQRVRELVAALIAAGRTDLL